MVIGWYLSLIGNTCGGKGNPEPQIVVCQVDMAMVRLDQYSRIGAGIGENEHDESFVCFIMY